MEEMITMYIVLMFILMILCKISPKNVKWERGNPEVITSVFCTICFNLIALGFSIISFMNYENNSSGLVMRLLMISSAICIIRYLIIQTWMLIKLVNVKIDKNNSLIVVYIVTLIWFALFIIISVANLTLYALRPDDFLMNDNISVLGKAFEIIYYTFMLMLTYSSDNIVVCGTVARICQMIEIIFFYIFVGIIICNLIAKSTEQIKA